MKNLILLLVCILSFVAIGSNTYRIIGERIVVGDPVKPEDGAVFSVASTELISLPCPKMTEVQRDALADTPTGGCIYNTTSAANEFWNGSDWVKVGSQTIVIAWTSGTEYGVGSLVYTEPDFKLWVANTAHTAGATFAGDIANWDEASDDLNRLNSSTDNAVITFDGTSGDVVQETGVIIDDNDDVTGVNDLTGVNLTATTAISGNTVSSVLGTNVGTDLSVTGTTTLNTSLDGVVKATAGVISASDVDLTSDITGILPIANGGTNSSTALTNDNIMYSQGGSIVESPLTLDSLGNLSSINNLSVGGVTTLDTSLSGVAKLSSGVVSTSDVDLTTEVTGILPIANGGTGSSTQNFVDLTTAQSIEGIKTFVDEPVFDSGIDVDGTSNFSALTTFNGQYVAISTTNGNRPCPMMTETQRDAITSPSSGDCVVNSDTNEVNFYLDSAWTLIGGGGAGSSRLNLMVDPSFENETSTATCTSGTLTYDTTNFIPTPNNTQSYRCSGSGWTQFIETNTTGSELEGRSGLLSIEVYTASLEDHYVATVIDGVVGTTDNVNRVKIQGGTGWKKYEIPFIFGSTSAGYAIVKDNVFNTSVSIDEVYVGVTPTGYIQSINESDTDYISYDPTLVGFGTTANKNFEFSRIGDKLVISGRFDCGTPTATEAQIPLPNSIQIKSGLPLKSYGVYGKSPSVGSKGGFVLATGGDSFLNMSNAAVISGTNSEGLLAGDGNQVCASGQVISFTTAPIPIEGWSTGRVNAFSQRRDFPVVEAAGNGGESITANVTDIPFTEVKDDFGLWDGDSFTADRDGYYVVSGSIRVTSAISPTIRYYIGGSGGKSIGRIENTNNGTFSGVVPMNKEEVLSLRINVGATLFSDSNNYLHHLHIQYFPTFADVIAQLSTDQIKGACFNTTYSETEIECGMRNGEMVYRRCFTVASDITTNTVIATWASGLNPIELSNYSGNRWVFFNKVAGGTSTDEVLLIYNDSDGDVETLFSGTAYKIAGGESYCMDYTK